MKKILITLLVLTAFGLDTYNTGAVNTQISKTNAYYLKVDKILDNFFIKVDKKGEVKAKAIYKKIIYKIDTIIEKSKSDKNTELLNYIKAKFIERLEKIIEIEENKTEIKKEVEKSNVEKTSEIKYTDDGRGAGDSRATTSQSEREAIITRNANDYTTTEGILKDGNMYATSFISEQVLGSGISLDGIKANMDFIKNKLDSGNYSDTTKFTSESLKILKTDYNKAYHFLYEGGILEETSNDGILSRKSYSGYEMLAYYFAEGSDSQIQVLRDLGYREGEGIIKIENETYNNIIYKDELNILKQKYDVPKY